LGEKMVIYHCVDEYSKFTGTNEAAILRMERRLMECADLVIVSSTRLLETKRSFNRNTVLITHGVDVPHFRKACTEALPAPAGPRGRGKLAAPADRLLWTDRRLGGSRNCAASGLQTSGVVDCTDRGGSDRYVRFACAAQCAFPRTPAVPGTARVVPQVRRGDP